MKPNANEMPSRSDACDGRLGVTGEHQRRHDRAGSDEHQQRGAEGLGQRPLAEGIAGLHLFLLRMMGADCDSTMPNAICNVLLPPWRCQVPIATSVISTASEAVEVTFVASAGGGEDLAGDHRGGVRAREAA